jgi:hypothetical protein
VQRAYKSLFELGFYLIREIDGWHRKTVPGTSFRSFLERIITSSFAKEMEELASLYKGAIARPTLLIKDTGDSEMLNWDDFKELNPSPVWYPAGFDQTVENPWKTYINSIPENKAAYGPKRSSPGASIPVNIRAGLDDVSAIIENFLKAVSHIKKELPAIAEQVLANHSQHEPHIGLILSFLELFEHAQHQMNTITGRHLDFYYKDVLGLKKKTAVPAHVHLIAEPAKHADRVMIPKDTLFKAGKDSLGKDVLFSTIRDSFINHAEITELRSTEISHTNIYAAAAVKMADGIEDEYEDPMEGWHPFRVSDKEGFAENLVAGIGFALSSLLFELSEGERIITITAELQNHEIINDQVSGAFRLFATGEEEWLELPDPSVTISGDKLSISATAPRDFPAIVSYQQDIHNTPFETTKPVLKLVLNQKKVPGIYHLLNTITVKKIVANVKVNGAQNLIVQNPDGTVDVTRPFRPFGTAPAIGTSMLVGSPEIFRKPLTKFNIRLNWQKQSFTRFNSYYNWPGFSRSNLHFKADVSLLHDNEWRPAGGNRRLFNNTNINLVRSVVTNSNAFSHFHTAELNHFKRFSHDLNRGFVKLSLSAPDGMFGHKLYPKYLAEYVKYVDGEEPEVEMPVEPFTPELASISADYEAEDTFMPGDEEHESKIKFFHLHPFGTDKTGNFSVSGGTKLPLLPKFKRPETSTANNFTGELYIGLDYFQPPGLVSFLVQIKDGTADPEATAATLKWYYLSKSGWSELKKNQGLRDDTHGFQNSGLVTLDIPTDAKSDNILLGSDQPLTWLKVSTEGDIHSIPKIIDFRPQAFQASFTDRGNAPDF